MAKTSAPLLSFDASGQIAKVQVYSKWRGVRYARRHVVPANPNTSEQQLTRNVFSFLQSVYKFAPTLATAPWEAYVTGKPLTGRNAFGKFNVSNLRPETDLNLLTLSPGALGGPAPSAVVVTPGNDQLSVAVTAPASPPTGWTAASAIVAAIPDQDPQSATDFVIVAGEDVTDPYTVVLAGLQDATLYQVRAWMKWTRPDGKTAYSPDIATTGLTT